MFEQFYILSDCRHFTCNLRLKSKSEDVQYMKFDSEGNLFLYEPGAGMSGIPRRVIQLGSDEVIYDDSENCGDLSHNITAEKKVKILPSAQIHRLVPGKGSVITNATDGKLRY